MSILDLNYLFLILTSKIFFLERSPIRELKNPSFEITPIKFVSRRSKFAKKIEKFTNNCWF